MEPFKKLGGRKFVFAVLVVLLAFTLALIGKLTESFTAIAVAAIAGFHTANAYVSGKALSNAEVPKE